MSGWSLVAELALATVEIALREVVLSGIVLAVVWPIARAMGRRGPAVRYALWSLVLLRLVLPPDLASPFSLGALLGGVASGAGGLSAHHEVFEAAPWESGRAAVARPAPVEEAPARQRLRLAAMLVLALWIVGAGVAARRLQLRQTAARRLVREAVDVEDRLLLGVFDDWCRRLRLRRQVRLLVSPSRVAPFTAGVARPSVVLPAELLERASQATLEAVVAHELVHVARWDTLWIAAQRVLATLFFFDPVVPWVNARIDECRESLVDAVVLRAGRLSRKAYARGIVEVLRARLDGLAAPALNPTKKGIAMRLTTILDVRGECRPRPVLAGLTAVMVGALVLPLAAVGGDRGTVAVSADASRLEPASPAMPQQEAARLELLAPVAGGRVTATFGPVRDPFTGEVRHHDGLDIAAPAGRAVLAPAPGVAVTPTEPFSDPAWGTVLVIDHGNGDSTVLAHLGELLVTGGVRVERGDEVARVGSTGRSTGPHVHFELRRDGVSVDPRPFVSSLH